MCLCCASVGPLHNVKYFIIQEFQAAATKARCMSCCSADAVAGWWQEKDSGDLGVVVESLLLSVVPPAPRWGKAIAGELEQLSTL